MSETKSIGQRLVIELRSRRLLRYERSSEQPYTDNEVASIIDKIVEERSANPNVRDTKRLDWLEKRHLDARWVKDVIGIRWQVLSFHTDAYNFVREQIISDGETLREAIDAAMKGESK